MAQKPNRGGRPRVLPNPQKITTYVPAETLARITTARGQTPLAEWVRQAIEQRLDRDTTH